MLKIYGSRPLRTTRCLWALEELGLPYEQVKVPDRRSDAFLMLNPLGKVPVLTDGDFVLTESVAINQYLVTIHPSDLYPDDVRIRARIEQWTSWAITELEFHFTLMVREIRQAGQDGRAPDDAVIAKCLEGAAGAMEPLERHLSSGNDFVAGNAFTIGDINACFPVAGIAPRLDMSRFPNVIAWVARCTGRAAWQRVQAIDEEALASL
jgi:glutathione S-transferase